MDKRSASGSAIYIMQSIKNRPFQTHMVGRLLNVPESTAQKQEYENLDTTEVCVNTGDFTSQEECGNCVADIITINTMSPIYSSL